MRNQPFMLNNLLHYKNNQLVWLHLSHLHFQSTFMFYTRVFPTNCFLCNYLFIHHLPLTQLLLELLLSFMLTYRTMLFASETPYPLSVSVTYSGNSCCCYYYNYCQYYCVCCSGVLPQLHGLIVRLIQLLISPV